MGCGIDKELGTDAGESDLPTCYSTTWTLPATHIGSADGLGWRSFVARWLKPCAWKGLSVSRSSQDSSSGLRYIW